MLIDIKETTPEPLILAAIMEEEYRSDGGRPLEIVRLIKNDKGLSAAVLKTINSAYYDLPYMVDNIERAVMLLGIKNIFILVKAFALHNITLALAMAHYWNNSVLIDIKKTTIMVIDDDIFQHQIINECLKDEPYKIISMLHGEPAMIFLLRNRPDLILLDINMPDFSGIEILDWIKSYKHLSGVPIIMVTRDKSRHTIIDCIKKGVTNYIVKPFTRSLLLEKVRTVLTSVTLPI